MGPETPPAIVSRIARDLSLNKLRMTLSELSILEAKWTCLLNKLDCSPSFYFGRLSKQLRLIEGKFFCEGSNNILK